LRFTSEWHWFTRAWQGRRVTFARSLLSLATPLAIALPPLYWVALATVRASLTPLGRDQGIFQYIAWALKHGAVDYRDVRDVNGPLTHLVHLAFLTLGGADEHRFRLLDLTVTGATFALAGACVAGLATRSRPNWLDRAGWALAGWVVLSGQYLLYGYWDLSQRESFFDWFMLPSVGLQLAAQGGYPGFGGSSIPPNPWHPGFGGSSIPPNPRSVEFRSRSQAGLFAVVGALSIAPWFGKPTYALFTLAQLVALVGDPSVPRKKALLAFVGGGALAAATQVAFLVAYGDPLAYLRIQLVDVTSMYRFIWPRAAADIFSNPWCATQAIFAVSGAVVLFVLILSGEMPRSLIGLALVPVCALVGVVAQGKGFPYHFHPVTAGAHLQWLAFAAWLTGRTHVARRRMALVRFVPVAAGLVVAFRVATAMEDSPHVRAVWLLWSGSRASERTTREYFAHFPEPDFFPFEMRESAEYIRQHTRPDDRVQTYGMDPYVLFLSERLSATPYIYAYDLNVDAAIAGGTGGRPGAVEVARIKTIRDAHEIDMLSRLESRPPAAFVFFDHSPLISQADAWDDLERHCARTAAWVRARYQETARFGHDHIWMRLDLAPDETASPDDDAIPDTP
jgi:hypothetical protein